MADLFDELCTLAVFGERLRVSERIQAGLPLSRRDAEIARHDNGIGTTGEYVEGGRRQLLRVARAAFPDRMEEFRTAVANQINEGTQKP